MRASTLGRESKMKHSQFLFVFFCTCIFYVPRPGRHFLGKVFSGIGGSMRSLQPGVLLPLVGSDLRQPPLSPWVVLSSRISVWTSDRYTSHPAGVRRGQKNTTDGGGSDPVLDGIVFCSGQETRLSSVFFVRLYSHVVWLSCSKFPSSIYFHN